MTTHIKDLSKRDDDARCASVDRRKLPTGSVALDTWRLNCGSLPDA